VVGGLRSLPLNLLSPQCIFHASLRWLYWARDGPTRHAQLNQHGGSQAAGAADPREARGGRKGKTGRTAALAALMEGMAADTILREALARFWCIS
jgi:hypothetical protein